MRKRKAHLLSVITSQNWIDFEKATESEKKEKYNVKQKQLFCDEKRIKENLK